MTPERLRCFVVVAEELHFTRAAQRLRLTPPAVSMAVTALEREVGAHLFRRSPRNVELTDAGRAVLIEARRVVAAADHWDRFIQRARDPAPVSGPRLIVGLHDAALGELTGPVVRALAQSSPHRPVVLRRLRYSENVSAIQSGAVDIVLGAESIAVAADAAFQPALVDPMSAVVGYRSELAAAPSAAVRDVIDLPTVRADPMVHSEIAAAPFLLTSFRNGERPRSVGDPVDDLDDIVRRVSRHDLVVVKNAGVARGMVQAGLVAIPIEDVEPLRLGLIVGARSRLMGGDDPVHLGVVLDQAKSFLPDSLVRVSGASTRSSEPVRSDHGADDGNRTRAISLGS